MMIDRRTFIAGATLSVVAPLSDLSAQPSSSTAGGMNQVVFLIDGWSVQSHDEMADQVWIKVDLGWRASWR